MKSGRFYLARVIKFGDLTQAKLMDAISNAPTVRQGDFDWTITDIIDERKSSKPFIFGNLTKYARRGEVKIVDEPSKRQRQAIAPNLLEASAPFVYLPDFSGLAFLHVWNSISVEVFPRRFKQIVEAFHDNFFVDCTVEPVTDYRAFLEKLRAMDEITELSAKVHPPNPLFGRLWESLNEYIEERNAQEVSVREVAKNHGGLSTQLVELIAHLLNDRHYEPPTKPSITDAAMLMAADGYGSGKAAGKEMGEPVIIRTNETQVSFRHEKEPEPFELATETRKQFQKISRERDMKH